MTPVIRFLNEWHVALSAFVFIYCNTPNFQNSKYYWLGPHNGSRPQFDNNITRILQQDTNKETEVHKNHVFRVMNATLSSSLKNLNKRKEQLS